MSRLDEALGPAAARLIGRAGTALTLRRDNPPSYDPVTGVVTETSSEIAVTGVVEDVEVGHPDGLVRRGDRMIMLAADTLSGGAEPAPGDAIVLQGTSFRVVSVASTWAGDRAVLHRLHVRR
jgi:hypothetical protein